MNQYKIMGITFLTIAVLVSIGFNIKIGIDKWQASVYQQGVAYGKAELNNSIIVQFLTSGRLNMTLPVNDAGQYDVNGSKTVQIVLIPQVTK